MKLPSATKAALVAENSALRQSVAREKARRSRLKARIDALESTGEARARELAEALEQQAATAEILKVISASPTDAQPVFDAIARHAVHLCDALFSTVYRFEGQLIHHAADNYPTSEMRAILTKGYPSAADADSATAKAIREQCIVHIEDVLGSTTPAASREVARALGYRTLLCVPMLRDSVPIGSIAVARRERRSFSDKQIDLIRTFAAQAAIAIENVRLFNETKEALEQQTATAEILRVIASSPTELQPVMDVVAESAARFCGATDVAVLRLEGESLRLVVAYGPHPSNLPIGGTIAASPGAVVGRAVCDRRTIHIEDLLALPEEFPETVARTRRATAPTRTVLATPLLREGVPIGVIGMRRIEVRPFTDKQIELAKTFADQAVIAIENVRLFTELQEKNRALTEAHAQVTESLEQQTATNEILRVISTSPTDVQPVFDAIAESAVRLCEARYGAVFSFDGDLVRLVAHHGFPQTWVDDLHAEYPMRPTRTRISGRAILSVSVVQIPDVALDPDYGGRTASRRGVQSLLGVPIIRSGVPIGSIVIYRLEPGGFPDKQIALLKTFADQAVIAIENVRLFNETKEALEQQTATGEILRVISGSPTEVQPVFDTIVQSAVRLCGARHSNLYRVDGDRLELMACHNFTAEALEEFGHVYPESIGQGEGPAARAVRERRVMSAKDVLMDPDIPEVIKRRSRVLGARSVLYVPMLREDASIGLIVVSRGELKPFSDKEIVLITTFADQAVIAIENVRLFRELQARTRELARSVEELKALGEVGQAVSSTLDLETVLTTIVMRAVQLSASDGGVVFEYDEGGEEFVQRVATETGAALAEARRTTRIRKGEGVLGRTAITLEAVQVPDITVSGAYTGRLRETLIQSGVRAILAVPMVREGRLIGCLGVTRNRPGEFPIETIELLRTFATQSALAIQNARLFYEIADKSRQLEAASHHKSEFLANMSHELRTPLNAILGFSEVLAERMFGEVNEKQAEYLQDILSSGRHLLSLINDILDLAKVEAGRLELELGQFHLPTALDNALTLVRERATRHGITLTQHVEPGIGDIIADERKVKQILLNLLSNAVKFTPEGGRVTLTAAVADGAVTIAVSDTGVGIAPEDQAAIFEEFRQVGRDDTRTQEGTGLGLTLAKKFVELHEGRIWVESQVGQGSTFTFTLPTRRDEEGASDQGGGEHPRP
jgi:GAF domain-containing protein/anti-sigma regulatory factor (Ser/Thr protein kinase)